MNAIVVQIASAGSRRRWLAASFALLAASLMAQNQPIYKVGDEGVTQPKVLYKVDPEYTQEAKDAHIEGTVVVKLVVTTEGVANDMQVVRGIDAGLDQKALEALARWKFQPATKDGQAVPVHATVEMNFRLK